MEITGKNIDDFRLTKTKTKFINIKTGINGGYLNEHCSICGNPFFSIGNYAKCCSKECRKLHNRKRLSFTHDFVKKYLKKELNFKLLSKEYKNMKTLLKIQCENGHIFEQVFRNIYKKPYICPKCRKSVKILGEEVLQLFNKYDLEVLSEEKDFKSANFTKIKFRCKKCDYFHQITFTQLKHNDKFECPRCNNKEFPHKIYFSEIKKGFEDEDGTVLSTEEDYKNQNTTPIHCICPNGHEQYKNVRKWRLGRRCQYCNTSGPELQVRKFIETLGLEVKYNDRIITKPTELDFYFPTLHKAIEFNGDYGHCNPKLYESDYFHKHKGKTASEIGEYDRVKSEKCKDQNVELYVLGNDNGENDPEIKDKIKDFLK